MLVVANRASEGAMREELEALPVALEFVDDLAATAAAAQSLRPACLLVDGGLSVRGHEELATAFAAAGCALKILLLPAATGEWIDVAHRSGADAIIPMPLQSASVARVLADGGAPGAEADDAAEVDVSFRLPRLVDRSDRMREVWTMVALASRSDASVLVSGETGVGKEVVARALHRFSHRRSGPFVAVNCAALPEALLESELFGHEKGAFTGAASRRKGRFELADGGTLFLDEVGDLPLALQVKLLRVLQERCFERVGGTQTVSVDVRVISATHRDLEDEVQRGRFRADLFYRVRVLGIRVAPLHMRKDDVLPLWESFLDEGARAEGRDPPDTTMAARRRLLLHRWPGNVRELQNAAQHASMLAGARAILPADLPELSTAASSVEAGGSLVGMTLEQIERVAILDTYAALGTVKAAAEALGISERKVHYRLRQYRKEGSTTARLRMADRGARSTAEADRAEEGVTRAPQILLAEDDDELRWGLHEYLQCAGYDVVAVRDGRSLLEHLGAGVLLEPNAAPPDAIITDVRMPFLTGVQLLQKVRDRGWATPVVVISAFGDDELKERATALGAAAFLDKPIDVDALLRILRSVVTH